MTRKRIGIGIDSILLKSCPYCKGKGEILSEETVASKVEREIKRLSSKCSEEAILVEVHPEVANLLNEVKNKFSFLEKNKKKLYIQPNPFTSPETMEIKLDSCDEIEKLISEI
jgi:ribonuclease G